MPTPTLIQQLPMAVWPSAMLLLILSCMPELILASAYELRLAQGPNLFEGMIEMRPTASDAWGTICSNVFKETNDGANVVCSALGFGATVGSAFVSYGPSTDLASPIWLDKVNCSAAMKIPIEPKSLEDCDALPLGMNKCHHGDDSGVRCVPPLSTWDFKLSGGLLSRGLVLMRPMPSVAWGTIHNGLFRRSAAARLAVCRSLGFTKVQRPTVMDSSAIPDDGQKQYLNITTCPDGATLQYCSHNHLQSSSWGASDRLAMNCDDDAPTNILQVRLVDGYSPSHGQVQVLNGTNWLYLPAYLLLNDVQGNVSNSSSYDVNALAAICRSLGYVNGISPAFRYVGAVPAISPLSKPTSAAPWSSITCSSTSTFSECTMSQLYSPVATSVPALPSGIDCYSDTISAAQWSIKLVNGSRPSLGLVQVKPSSSGPWGYVMAGQRNDFYLWESICSALGYSGGNYAKAVRDLSNFTHNIKYLSSNESSLTPMYWSDIRCPQLDPYVIGAQSHAGPALTIPSSSCQMQPFASSSAIPSAALALDCNSSLLPSTSLSSTEWSAIMPYGRYSTIYFRPTYGHRGGRICTKDTNALLALCRLAGYSATLALYATPTAEPDDDLYGDSSSFYLYNLRCTAGASQWSDCTFDHFAAESCDGSSIAAARCYDASLWRLRLNGTMPGKGRLEVQLSAGKSWGTVCNYGWNQAATYAACRSLGYQNVEKAYAYTYTWPGQDPILITAVCSGQDLMLQNCSHDFDTDQNECYHSQDVALNCVGDGEMAIDRSLIEYRGVLVSTNSYRIEFRYNTSQWGVLLHDYSAFMNTLPATACRTIGAYSAGMGASFSTMYLENATFIMSVPQCNAMAPTLNDCALDLSTYSRYYHYGLPIVAYVSAITVNCNLAPFGTKAGSSSWQFMLTNSSLASRGLLLMKPNVLSPWGTVCDDLWSLASTQAACRMLGYDYRTLAGTYSPYMIVQDQRVISGTFTGIYGMGAGYIWMDNVECRGYDTERLGDCSSNEIGSHNCNHVEDVTLECDIQVLDKRVFEYRLILVHPSAPHYGRVEMRPSATAPWGTIEATTYGRDELAKAVCGSLGMLSQARTRKIVPSLASTELAPLYAKNWDCPYGAASMNDCLLIYSNFNTSRIVNYNALTVDCDYSYSDPALWTFRLAVGGSASYSTRTANFSGRFEVRTSASSDWSTVCGNFWSQANTASACATLARGSGPGWVVSNIVPSRVSALLFGNASAARVALSNVTCPTELFINCSYQYPTVVLSCLSHELDVALICPSAFKLSEFEFRLVPIDPLLPSEGRLEMRPGPSAEWGTIRQSTSDSQLAKLACHALGYADSPTLNPYYGVSRKIFSGSGQVWFSGYDCSGTTTSLLDCPFNQSSFGLPGMPHDADLIIDCNDRSSVPLVSSWGFRLAEGTINGVGRLEMRPGIDGDWGTVSSDGFDWGHAVAACRAAGYTSPSPTRAEFASGVVEGTGYIWASFTNCPSSSLNSLSYCANYTYRPVAATHSNDVWLDCYPKLQMRLVGGDSDSSGRVEVRAGNWSAWGSLCNDFFDESPAAWRVVCQAMGKRGDGTYQQTYGYGTGPIALDDLRCPDGAEGLEDCEYRRPLGTSNCVHSEDAGVTCFTMTATKSMSATSVPSQSRARLMSATSVPSPTRTRSIPNSRSKQTPSISITPHITTSATLDLTKTIAIRRTTSLTQTKSKDATESTPFEATKTRQRTNSIIETMTVSNVRSETDEIPPSLSRIVTGTAMLSRSESINFSPTVSKLQTQSPTISMNSTISFDIMMTLSDDQSPSISRSTTSTGSFSNLTSAETSSDSISKTVSTSPSNDTLSTTSTFALSNATLSDKGSISIGISVTALRTQSQTIQIFPQPVLVQAVPEAVTVAMTSVAVAVGGASAAVDAQALALIGLVDCGAEGDAGKSRKGYRSLSPVAIRDSCEGVLIGNIIALGSVAAIQIVAVLLLYLLRKMTIPAAMALARAPSILVTVSTLLLTSLSVCGPSLIRDGQATLGGLSIVIAVIIPSAFPLLSALFASRRLEHVEYDWSRRRKTLASYLLPMTQLDPSYPSVNAFGSIIGSNRLLGSQWSMVSLLSFFAGLPLSFAYQGNCIPLFGLSASLFYVSAFGVALTRPRRVLASDVLHVVVLLLNGSLMGISAGLLKSPGTKVLEVATTGIGYALTGTTGIRIVLMALAMGTKLLAARGFVKGIRTVPLDEAARRAAKSPALKHRRNNLNFEGLLEEEESGILMVPLDGPDPFNSKVLEPQSKSSLLEYHSYLWRLEADAQPTNFLLDLVGLDAIMPAAMVVAEPLPESLTSGEFDEESEYEESDEGDEDDDFLNTLDAADALLSQSLASLSHEFSSSHLEAPYTMWERDERVVSVYSSTPMLKAQIAEEQRDKRLRSAQSK